MALKSLKAELIKRQIYLPRFFPSPTTNSILIINYTLFQSIEIDI